MRIKIITLRFTASLLILPFVLLSPGTQNIRTAAAANPSVWSLVWQDEFNGANGSPIDPTKWTAELGGWGWGNNELEYYTVARHENARVEKGKLVIEARKEL